MGGLPFTEYLRQYGDDLIFETQRHALLSLYVIGVATVIGVLIAIAVYRFSALANLSISAVSVGFTLPSIALFTLMVPLFGPTLGVVFPVLVMYALLPIVRNAIVGLQSVDEAMVDAARGMGMGRFRMLWQIEVPTAWPVILAGIRVSAQLTVGLVAIAAFVVKVGLGDIIFDSMSSLGSANSFNEALAGTLLVVLIALVLDLVFVLIRRLTTPRGLRV